MLFLTYFLTLFVIMALVISHNTQIITLDLAPLDYWLSAPLPLFLGGALLIGYGAGIFFMISFRNKKKESRLFKKRKGFGIY